jgi:CheY-like chemotaxis protein
MLLRQESGPDHEDHSFWTARTSRVCCAAAWCPPANCPRSTASARISSPNSIAARVPHELAPPCRLKKSSFSKTTPSSAATWNNCCASSVTMSPSTGTIAGARELMERDTFDLIFLDVRLPDGEGTDLLREMQAHPGKTAGRHGHRVRLRRIRRGMHAQRRVRLHAQALLGGPIAGHPQERRRISTNSSRSTPISTTPRRTNRLRIAQAKARPWKICAN